MGELNTVNYVQLLGGVLLAVSYLPASAAFLAADFAAASGLTHIILQLIGTYPGCAGDPQHRSGG